MTFVFRNAASASESGVTTHLMACLVVFFLLFFLLFFFFCLLRDLSKAKASPLSGGTKNAGIYGYVRTEACSRAAFFAFNFN